MRSSGGAPGCEWVQTAAGAGQHCEDPPASCTGTHQEVGSASYPCIFGGTLVPPSSQGPVPHTFQAVLRPLFYLVRKCCSCLTNSCDAPEGNRGRDRSGEGAAQTHVSADAAYRGLCPYCVTWHVTDRAGLTHWILTHFLVHFSSSILPQWPLEHSSCSEAPKQSHTGWVPGPQAGFWPPRARDEANSPCGIFVPSL